MESDTREIKIHGCCEVPKNIPFEEFYDKFIEFVESNGWYFGGGINEFKEK